MARQNTALTEQKGDQQPAQAAVAIEKGWIVSNWTCTNAALTSSGTGVPRRG